MKPLIDYTHAELLDLLDSIGVYAVSCARCGKDSLSCHMIVEEGNEWECWDCNERENTRERLLYAEKAPPC